MILRLGKREGGLVGKAEYIRDTFSQFRISSKPNMSFYKDYYWVVKLDGKQGVAIKVPKGQDVNERLENIFYFTKEYSINGQDHNLLLLLSNQPRLYNDFATICAGFLDKLEDQSSYNEIQDNPISWWHMIKELIGNTNVEKATYSALAEMLSYYYLLKNGKDVSWVGPFGGSVDINGSEGDYEVKSTLSRYKSEVTISSQYQLKAKYLLFYRFEPDTYGISIQDMVRKLIDLNIDEQEIEKSLHKLDYPIGSEIRMKSYKILEVMKYLVDDNFPKILPENFIGGKLPAHITELTYKVSLDGLNGEAIDLKEFI